jgi:hypothetical protein
VNERAKQRDNDSRELDHFGTLQPSVFLRSAFDAVAHNQPVNTILPERPHLSQVTRSTASLPAMSRNVIASSRGYHNLPSTRSARSMWAVAASMSAILLVWAAFNISSAA